MSDSRAGERRELPRIGGRIMSADCPSRALMGHITSKWGVLALVALSEGPRRWSELRHGIGGISEKMLAQTLRTLEGDGLVYRDSRPVVPPYVEYGLTDAGAEVTALLLPLLDWAENHAVGDGD
ncbi:helix-turn-helix domain-containing protein [Nocardiopsis sp. MG754419]|uniref:winged helix-turn-helix transcriptional regulator n=1 Tax=Nocardiopsis sp. MG754419 TaxID=2259865 RepID=UPI0027DAD430|nr:helix-turn-helix domain-containing protein [Nocardiopsis sp. MG754419]MBR8742279.1 transcriptional regulator [Nocardiopsis sp. MG754419]